MAKRDGRQAALKAWKTRRRLAVWQQVHAAEAASKAAFKTEFESRGWRIAFFEGKTGSPRTGIVDAIAFRIDPKNVDCLDLRLVQLKGGKAGVSGSEVARLKKAVKSVRVDWLLAMFDGESLHVISDRPMSIARKKSRAAESHIPPADLEPAHELCDPARPRCRVPHQHFEQVEDIETFADRSVTNVRHEEACEKRELPDSQRPATLVSFGRERTSRHTARAAQTKKPASVMFKRPCSSFVRYTIEPCVLRG